MPLFGQSQAVRDSCLLAVGVGKKGWVLFKNDEEGQGLTGIFSGRESRFQQLAQAGNL
jgi:hypothetical protein